MSSNELIPDFVNFFAIHLIKKSSFARGSLGFLDLNCFITSFWRIYDSQAEIGDRPPYFSIH
jgi:hypothetical protein